MKQKYIKPAMNAYRLQLSHNMLTTSEIKVSSSSYDSSKGSIMGRSDNSSWDDED